MIARSHQVSGICLTEASAETERLIAGQEHHATPTGIRASQVKKYRIHIFLIFTSWVKYIIMNEVCLLNIEGRWFSVRADGMIWAEPQLNL